MNTRLFLLVIGLGAVSTLRALAAEPEINEHSVFELPSTLQRLTQKPRLVSETIAALCTSPSPDLIAREAARTGPHTGTLVNIYVSESAVQDMASSTRRFAEGTVVLKEKLSPEGKVAAVGGMVKRSPGFDTAHNDWEYFYAEKGKAMSKGLLPNCIACHAKVGSTDYVFTMRRPGEG